LTGLFKNFSIDVGENCPLNGLLLILLIIEGFKMKDFVNDSIDIDSIIINNGDSMCRRAQENGREFEQLKKLLNNLISLIY